MDSPDESQDIIEMPLNVELVRLGQISNDVGTPKDTGRSMSSVVIASV